MASNAAALSALKELFPDWSEEDLTICLEESRGDLDTATTRILEGHATKFGEVTKKKEKVPKRLEHGNGRGRGRGASTSAPRGRSEFRGRGRGRGVSTSNAPNTSGRNAGATAVETTPQWADVTDGVATESTPAWADADDVTTSATTTTQQVPDAKKSEQPTTTTQQTPADGQYTSAKPKARIVDKNSTSSWASIAKVANPPPPVAAPQQTTSKQRQVSIHDTPAPLTERNLEAVTEDQPDLPEPPAATVASIQGEPATGPSSLAGGSVIGGPPGLKSGQAASSARVSTPVGGRRLNQNEAVVMPGSEREPASRLGVQFGSLGLGEDEIYDSRNAPAQQKHEAEATKTDFSSQGQRSNDFGGYGASAQQPQQSQAPVAQQTAYGCQSQEQYPSSTSNFYGQHEQARASPFGTHNDYYQQQASHGQQHQYGGYSAMSQRSDTTSRPTEHSSRFGEPASTPMTSVASQPPQSGASPVPSHLSGHQQQSQYPMHPQYGAPNPYAYYGYGYGYPQQQQHSGYGGQMYGQQPRGGYGGQGQYPGGPITHQSVGTSQDRFERSTAEYQRQQQQNHYPQAGFGNTDFLGSSKNQQPQQPSQSGSNDAHDPFKGYGNSNVQGSTGSREDGGKGNAGAFASQGYGQQQQQQQPAAGGYGSHGSQYGEQGQSPYSQYGNYGRQGGAHQQYGGQWNY